MPLDGGEKGFQSQAQVQGKLVWSSHEDLLWSSGRPTAILGVRTPGRPLNLHAGQYRIRIRIVHALNTNHELLICDPTPANEALYGKINFELWAKM